MEKSQIAKNLQRVKLQTKENTTLVVVTKTRTEKEIDEAISSGATVIGENRVQEAEQKFILIKNISSVEKRLIGPLQSNKINKAVRIFDTIDTVGSVKLATRISQSAKKVEKKQRVLLQINSTGSEKKNGFLFEQEEEILECFGLKNIKVEGFMTMGPNTEDKKEIEKAFKKTEKLFNKINKKTNNQMHTLSMGMSGDFYEAQRCGSNMVRVGTAIFGPRK